MIKSVDIGGVRYSVAEVEGLERAEDGAFLYGEIMHTDLTIKIEADMAQVVKVQALLHEALHGLFHQTGHYDIEDEERVVQMLGCQLPKLLKDNPELVSLLLGDADD